MTNSGESSSNKSPQQHERQAVPQTQPTETNVNVEPAPSADSPSRPLPATAELGHRTSVPPQATPPRPPQVSPLRPPQITPLRPPQVTLLRPPQATHPRPPHATTMRPPQGTSRAPTTHQAIPLTPNTQATTPPRPTTQATPPSSRPQVVPGGRVMDTVPVGPGGGIQVGGSAGGSMVSHFGVGGPSRPNKRKVAEIVAPPGVEPVCSVCRRDFGSWKALFGHMRSHPDRQWRGCFPPPVAQQPAQGDQAPVAEDQAAAFAEGGDSGQGSRVAALNIDLNKPDEGETDHSAAPASASGSASSASNKDGASGGFDLNMPPSSDEGQDGGAGA